MKKIFFSLVLLFFTGHLVFAKEAIVYSHLSGDGYWQIWVMDPDGKNQGQITTSPQDKRDPTWLAGGAKIAFRTSNSELFGVNLNGQNEIPYLQEYGVVTNPDFSPARDEIIFVRFEPALDPNGGDVSDIWKWNSEHQRAAMLTQDHRAKYQPKFSQDGRRIAFVKSDETRANYHIWMMDTDGGNQKQLTWGTGYDTHPEFSRDQQSLTFSSNRENGFFDIYVMDLRTDKARKLTGYQGLDTHSSFSLDGEKIVYVSDRSGAQQIWVMNTDGTNPVQLTFEQGESIDPEWGEIQEGPSSEQ